MNISSPSTPAPLWRIILDALPLTTAFLLILFWAFNCKPEPKPNQKSTRPTPIKVESAAALETAFNEIGYAWPPSGPVPRLALQQLPSDLAELPTQSRKSLFFASLAPLVLIENERLQQKRTQLEALLAAPLLSAAEQEQLAALADRYAVTGDLDDPQTRQQLLNRVDEIPLALALAQAAKESGWGTSRFAQQGRNLFGVWTWDQSQGLVPKGRQSGLTHLVRVFPNLQASVRNYLHTLNTGAVYASLRQQRAQQRAAGAPLQALILAEGLERYSERGEAYVKEVQAMILSNQLHQFDELVLAP